MTNTVLQAYKNIVSIDFDNWNEDTIDDSLVSKTKIFFNFSIPPLAIVVSMLEAGKEKWEIGETIKSLGLRPDIKIDTAVTKQHQKIANEIYEYFAKKYTMRRLKNEHISEYMLAVEELCENQTQMNAEHVGILVTLPKFFKENQQLESLMRSNKSVTPKKSKSQYTIDETIEFVKSICIDRKNKSETHYFWSRSDGTLMRTVSKTYDIGNSGWDCLSRVGKIHVSTNCGQLGRIQGYDFYVLDFFHPSSISIVS